MSANSNTFVRLIKKSVGLPMGNAACCGASKDQSVGQSGCCGGSTEAAEMPAEPSEPDQGQAPTVQSGCC